MRGRGLEGVNCCGPQESWVHFRVICHLAQPAMLRPHCWPQACSCCSLLVHEARGVLPQYVAGISGIYLCLSQQRGLFRQEQIKNQGWHAVTAQASGRCDLTSTMAVVSVMRLLFDTVYQALKCSGAALCCSIASKACLEPAGPWVRAQRRGGRRRHCTEAGRSVQQPHAVQRRHGPGLLQLARRPMLPAAAQVACGTVRASM